MQKITFEDLPSTTTPINATNLNAIQSNVEGAFKNTNTTSTTDGYCCTYINNLVNWALAGNTTARNYINVPSESKELRMITYVGDVYYTVDLLVSRLSTTYKYVKLGSDTDYVYYEYNGTGVRCVQAYVGGQSNIDSASTYMYYK